MAVNVANTAAAVSGKTLLLAEATQTITGATTFDRGASAPFIAVSGAAKVTHLDADKVDGEEAADFHNASLLALGTVPDARFPATLPAASGVNLTALNASNLGSGTVPDARFPATLPAASGANLTALNASNVSSGTLANARLHPTVAPTVSALVDGATPALDAALGNVFTLQAAGNRTIAIPTNPVDGQKIIIAHTASGADRTLALNAGAGGFRFGTDITGLTATTSAKTDYIGCIYNAVAGFWDVVAVSKGY